MTPPPTIQPQDSKTDPEVSNRILTIPNVICILRIAGSFALIALAILNEPIWVIGLFLFLSATDWVDGKLAILLNQRSVLGAQLDSAADVVLYAALLVSCIWLQGDFLLRSVAWFAVAIGSYAISVGVCFRKFGRAPSYHTRAAKSCWLFVLIGAFCLLAEIATWPILVTMVAVTLTNVETTLITLVLNEWHADVSSLAHARRIRRSQPA